MNDTQKQKLAAALPEWAVTKHPTKTYLSVIHPMAVIDRLNEVFGVGAWHFKTEYLDCKAVQQGQRQAYMSAVKGTLSVPEFDIHIEQYGGSTNDDMGDALKGGATDALTKCASYLGVGASIYKGQGNTEPPKEWTVEEALHHVAQSTDSQDLVKRFKELSATMQKDNEVLAKCTELKEALNNQ